MMDKPRPTEIIKADSCMEGGGGHDTHRYYSIVYTPRITVAHHISQLEVINCLLAFRTLSSHYTPGTHVELICDNMATIMSFSGYRGRDRVINAASRAIWTAAHQRGLLISFTHHPGELMTLADALSRKSLGAEYENIANDIVAKECLIPIEVNYKNIDYSHFV